MNEFNLNGKVIRIFENLNSNTKVPIIYLNTVMNEGKSVFNECLKMGCKDFILVEIAKISWDNDLTPWYMEPISKGDRACLGLADKHLNFIINNVLNEIEKIYENKILYNIIAGYSLGGLFAFYSLYQTNIFSKVVCASASFWYKNFVEYIKENEMKIIPASIYFSLGDKEAKTDNEYLKTVENNTIKIKKHCDDLSIKNIFEFNQGGHFKDGNIRMAKGIKWILDN